MGLSNDLISQFVKATNDTPDIRKEAVVYGTTVELNGKMYVKIDGSDLITPVISTMELKKAERVSVLIKDHYAMVTGNISNPGATVDTTDGIKDELNNISADIGNFELVLADKVSTGQLEATVAIINTALMDKATIGELEAVKAQIKDLDVIELEAELAKIEQAIIGKAEIADLDAVNARIDMVEIDVGVIETLVGGNLTMDNIQSLVLTASKVTVDNAFIKDAMIDKVSANKLFAGTVNTNNVNIESEDGSMILRGSLQQFKDAENNVRIQIGKDATGDFTFALYGADGTGQLINQNGITASAIGDGLIVNTMVSNDAAISGSKLDIASVVTEVNEGTTTIKGSKIYLDDKAQTLDMAFDKLSTTVTENGETIETMGTEFEVSNGKIETLISNTTIKKENGEVVQLKDDYAQFKIEVDGFASTVSELDTKYGNALKNTKTQYYVSLSAINLVGGTWSESQPEWTTGKYIWQRLVYIYGNGNTEDGTAVCIQGAKGDQGIQGPQGDKGDTGASGVGVKDMKEYYQVSTSNITQPTTWLTTIPTMTATNKYLWTYEDVIYTDNTIKPTTKRVIGVYGDKGQTGSNGADGKPGQNGVSITGVINYYLATNSATGVTTSTSGWTTTIQSISSTKRYLWNYEKINYSSGNPTSTQPCIKGVYGEQGATGADGKPGATGPSGDKGDKGDSGQSVTSITPQFAKHTSATVKPGTTTWFDVCPPYERGKYLWIRSKVIYANPSATKYTEPYYDASWDAKGTAEEAATTVTSKVSEFEQTLDGFETRVGKTEVKLNGMKFSAYNYALVTDTEIEYGGTITDYDTSTSITYIEDQFKKEAKGKEVTLSLQIATKGAKSIASVTTGQYKRIGCELKIKYTDGKTVWLGGDCWYTPNTNNLYDDKDERVYATFKLEDKDIESVQIQGGIYGVIDGMVRVSRPMLNIGNIQNGWQANPKDIVDEIDDSGKMQDQDGSVVYIKDKLAETITTVDGVTTSVSAIETYFDEDGMVTEMSKQMTQFSQLANKFDMDFWTKLQDTENGVKEMHDYITFSADGITIGQESYPVKLVLTKDRIKFVNQDGAQLAYFSEGKLFVNNAEILSTIKIANYGFLPTAGGSLTIAAIK